MQLDFEMAAGSTGRTQKLPGCSLPVLRNPESHATASSLERIDSHAKRWGSLGLPHGSVHTSRHGGIHFSLQSRSRLKVLCGIVYITTLDFGNRVVSKLKVGSSNKLTDSDSEEFEEEIIHIKPLIQRIRDSLKSVCLDRVANIDSFSPLVKSFHRHLEIVCRLLSKFEQFCTSSAPVNQKPMNYYFIHSFLCFLSRFNELSIFSGLPSDLSVEVEACKKAFSSSRQDPISLMDTCSSYLEDNEKSKLEMKIPIDTIPLSEHLNISVLKRVIDKVCLILNLHRNGDSVPSDSGGNEVDDKNLPILSNDERSQFGSHIHLENQTHLVPFVQAPSAASLPSFSSTFLNRTRFDRTDVTPCSLEPVNQFPLYFDHPTSASFSSSTSGFCSRGSGLTEINYSESDSHFEDCRLMLGENRAVREMGGMISCSEYPTKYAEMSKTEMNKETTCENRTDSGLMISPNNLGGPDKQHKRVSSSFDDRENVVLKIQKTPSPVQIASDDSDSTPPTSLSSSGHPISTQLGDDNPISSESQDIPLTDENLQLLKEYQGISNIRYFHFFKKSTSGIKNTCLLCNKQVKSPRHHIELHPRSGQSLQELFDYCCNTRKVPRFTLTAKMIGYVLKLKFEEQVECPLCFARSDEGWTHFGVHILRAHFKDADRSCNKLDALVKKCFVNVSLDESRVTRFSCAICGRTYQSSDKCHMPPDLYYHIATCLRLESKKQLVDRVADYEHFLEECKKVKTGECPKCKNKIKDFLWPHFDKCKDNYTCGMKCAGDRRICHNCHIPVGSEDFEEHSNSCDNLRDLKTRFVSKGYYVRVSPLKVKCTVALGENEKCGECCCRADLPAHLSEAHQIEGIKDEDWILCDGKCWCQWCGKSSPRFAHLQLDI